MGNENTESVSELIRSHFEEMTRSEGRAAQALLANYPMQGLETVANFASAVGVSGPTILRFVSRLGFNGYPAFQRRLRMELEAQMRSPLAKPSTFSAGGDFLNDFSTAVVENISQTVRLLPKNDLDDIIGLLSDQNRPLHVLGGRFTDSLARFMTSHLRIVRRHVLHIDGQPDNWRDQLIDMDRRNVLFLIDIRRYQRDLMEFAEAAAERRVTIVLLTDQWISPIARRSRFVLQARVAVPSPWDSHAALLTIIEILIAGISARRKINGEKRIGTIEGFRGDGA